MCQYRGNCEIHGRAIDLPASNDIIEVLNSKSYVSVVGHTAPNGENYIQQWQEVVLIAAHMVPRYIIHAIEHGPERGLVDKPE